MTRTNHVITVKPLKIKYLSSALFAVINWLRGYKNIYTKPLINKKVTIAKQPSIPGHLFATLCHHKMTSEIPKYLNEEICENKDIPTDNVSDSKAFKKAFLWDCFLQRALSYCHCNIEINHCKMRKGSKLTRTAPVQPLK